MTDHAEINRQLALAIGWKELLVDLYGQLWVGESGQPLTGVFDYRHPDVIWPIAERYNCFPTLGTRWVSNVLDSVGFYYGCVGADTPALAVALAVIQRQEKLARGAR